jgi:hypothetical protein
VATTQKIFNSLVADGAISVRTGSFRTHDNLRTRLVKLFATHKKTLNSIGYADSSESFGVCATWDEGAGTSTYTLAVPKKATAAEYEIVEPAQ